jgi:site-specific DNA-cytosine methylase
MAAGFRRAGIEFLAAFDKDENACESYAANLGHRPHQMDVRDLVRWLRAPSARMRPRWFRELVAGGLPTLDLIVADPPCTPWSRAGKRRGLSDPNDCLRVTVDLIALLRPKAYLIGNVPGLDDSVNLPVIHEVFAPLRQAGYCTADYRRLDAADYGVPQHRVRPFWFGHLHGPCLAWPVPTHCDPRELATASLFGEERRPWVTCAEALEHLPLEELGQPVQLRWKDRGEGGDHRPTHSDEPAKTITRNTHSDGALLAIPNHMPHFANEPAKVITAGDGGGAKRALVFNRRHPPARAAKRPPQGSRIGEPCRPAATVTCKPSRVGAGAAVVFSWPWERPSTTVCGGIDVIAAPGRSGSQDRKHGLPYTQSQHPGAIKLSERAAAILQGFPDTWTFCGATKRARWSQLGMAIPPALAHAVAGSIVRWFERHSERPALAALDGW